MWVRIDDRFPDHPRIVGLGDRAFRLYVVGLCYSARFLTDGHVPADAVQPYAKAAEQLTRRGLWLYEPDSQEWLIHDWSDYNPSAEQVRSQRKADRERKRSQRRDDEGRFLP